MYDPHLLSCKGGGKKNALIGFLSRLKLASNTPQLLGIMWNIEPTSSTKLKRTLCFLGLVFTD